MIQKRLFGFCLCVLLLCSVFPVRLVAAEDVSVDAPTESTPIDGSEEQSGDVVPSNEQTAPDTVDEEADDPIETAEADSDGTDGTDHADSDASDDNSTENGDRDDPDSTEVSENPETDDEEAAGNEEGDTEAAFAFYPSESDLSDIESESETNNKAALAVQSPLFNRSVLAPTVNLPTTFIRVSSGEQLSSEDTYIVVCRYDDQYYMLGKETFRSGLTAITVVADEDTGNTLVCDSSDTAFFTCVDNSGAYAFYAAKGYLSYAYKKKYTVLLTEDVSTDGLTPYWYYGGSKITSSVTVDGEAYNCKIGIQKYKSTPYFITVSADNTESGTVWLYKAVSTPTPTPAPTPTPTSAPTPTPTPLPVYTVAFDPNGGAGGPESGNKTHGEAFVIPTDAPVREGFSFLGWAESSDATEAVYQGGDRYERDGNITLYAVWRVNPPVGERYGVLIGNTLVLDGTININFYVSDAGGAVIATLSDGAATESFILREQAYSDTYKGYRLPYTRIAAAETEKVITLRMYDGDGNELPLRWDNGMTIDGTSFAYSVSDWCHHMMAPDAGKSEETVALAKAMLQYGAHAAHYFNNAAVNPTYYGGLDTVMPSAVHDAKIPENFGDVGFIGATLLLQSDTSVRLYFDREITLAETADSGITIGQNGAYWYAEKAHISAPDLAHKYHFAVICDGQIYSFRYSALSYANGRIEHGDAAIGDLCRALYIYYEAANAYFRTPRA